MFQGEEKLTEKILGQLETLVLDNEQHVLGIPSHWKINPNNPLKFYVKINEKNQLILEGPVIKSSKIDNPWIGADKPDN